MRTRIQISLAVLVIVIAAVAAQGQQLLTGTLADGAQYELAVPQTWNGTLVVYAHGIVDPQAPVQLPSANEGFGPLRDALTQFGFAVASSSWSENGYAVQDGVLRTHQLPGIFTARVGKPQRVLLMGSSLGGLVALKLAELYPQQYNGALVMCGVVGGGTSEVASLANTRILYDYFFPGTLPGDAFHTPTLDFSPGSQTFNTVLGTLVGGLFAPGQPTLQLISTANLTGSNLNEFLQSALTGVGFGVRFSADLLDHTHGHVPFDNTQTVYAGSADDALLNLRVERFNGDPDALRYVAHSYDPTGRLRIPVLTLHTTLDPVVPFAQEAAYAQQVAQGGSSAFLVQQRVARYGHCNFKGPEVVTSFLELAAWSANPQAVPPAGDVTQP